jgi:hypothetical protein
MGSMPHGGFGLKADTAFRFPWERRETARRGRPARVSLPEPVCYPDVWKPLLSPYCTGTM